MHDIERIVAGCECVKAFTHVRLIVYTPQEM